MPDLETNGPHGGGMVTLREYIERIFEEHRLAHNARHQADEKALQQARETIDHRLQGMNEFRAEIEKDRRQFLRSETFDGYVKAEETRRRSTNLALATIGLTMAGLVIAVISLIAQ